MFGDRIIPRPGLAQVLLQRVLKLIDDLHDRFGARPSGRNVSGDARAAEASTRPDEPISIKPEPDPSAGKEFYVSYAWRDDLSDEGRQREADVDRLRAEASAKGIAIIRDKTAMRYGDRFSKFMTRLGRGNRVFIILSDKYLKSAYCMHELFEVWRNCREDDAEFIARTRVFALASATIGTPPDRAQYAIYWRKRFEELDALVKANSQLVLSDADNADYRRMTRFVSETVNILKLVQDVLHPRTSKRF